MSLKEKYLKNYRIVETREGNFYLVVRDADCPFRDGGVDLLSGVNNGAGFMLIESFSDDLTTPDFCYEKSRYDIIAVYKIINNLIHKIFNDNGEIDKSQLSLIWRREPSRKTMTVSQIEKELGYPIEIISEEDV